MGGRKKVATRRKKIYIGYLEFSFTPREMEDVIGKIAKRQLESQEHRFDDYIRVIRTLQRKTTKLETQVAKLEMRKK